MTLIKKLTFATAIGCFFTSVAYAQSGSSTLQEQTVNPSTAELEERIRSLEATADRLQEQVGSRAVINSFNADRIDLGGFLHSTVTSAHNDEGSSTSFNRNIFELLIKAELNDQWSAFIAQAFLRQGGVNLNNNTSDPSFNDRGSPGVATDTVIAWVNYQKSNGLNVRVGRFLTPHGIINIEHFPALLLDPEQPQFLRPFSGDTIFPNFVTGLEVHGNRFSGSNALSYHLYAGYFAGVDEEPVYGGRVAYELGDIGLTFGLNASTGSRSDNSVVPAAVEDYSLVGVDVLLDYGKLLWKTEYYETSEDLNGDRKAYYTQPGVRLSDKIMAFYRYDFLDKGELTGLETTEHALGIAYRPVNNTILRFTATQRDHEFDNAASDFDAEIYQASLTVAF